MQNAGYTIHEGRYTTYEMDAEHRIRDVRLGSEFEKDAIKAYFDEKQAIIDDLRNGTLDDRCFQISINKSSLLSDPCAESLIFELPGTKGEKRISIPRGALSEKESTYIFKFKGDIVLDIDGHLGRCKKTILQLQSSIEARRQILAIIQKFREIQDAAKRIIEMPDGEEKEQLSKENAVLLRKYKNLSAYLHSKKVYTFAEQQDFEVRLKDASDKYAVKKEEMQELIANYIKWKKLKDTITQAEEDAFPYNGEPMKSIDHEDVPPTPSEQAVEALGKSVDDFPAQSLEKALEKPPER